uniref:SWIM-type domain-containing protein n=1 Tax=Triticum urartu TaxID=4572 RepID=A0A8R7JZR5_TRIUA
MVQLRANTRGLGHLIVVESANWSAEVWDNSKNCERHVVKLNQQTCTCLEWQHTGKPCQHVLAFVTSQKRVNLEQFVHEYYSVDRFKAAYGREIEPMTDKSQWPPVELPFVVGAPLAKRNKGRQRKLRIKGCLEGGHKKKGANDAPKDDDSTAPTNSKGKKMIRGPVTCKKCGEKGHRQASYKCPLNGTKKWKRKPRKNNTKARPAEPSTPQRPTREQILQDSPSMVTRSRLAILLGEGSSSQTTRTTPERMPTAAPPKKMTPRRMPATAPPKKMTPKRKLSVG